MMNVTIDNVTSLPENEPSRQVIYQTIAYVSYALIAIGIPGNLLVILSISLTKQLRSAPNFMVLSLSCCDFLFLSVVVPAHLHTYVVGRWTTFPELCWLVATLSNTLLGSSILSTGAIAINRYVAVVLSGKYRMISSKRTVTCTLVAVYLIPVILTFPTMIGVVGHLGFDPDERQCGTIGGFVLLLIRILILILVPFVLMTVCYIHIVLFVLASGRRVGVTAGSLGTAGNNTATEARLSRMLAMVYLVFMATMTPQVIVKSLAMAGVDVPWYMHVLVFVFIWTSSAINPIIYGLVNKRYRDAYRGILRTLLCQKMTRIESIQSTESSDKEAWGLASKIR